MNLDFATVWDARFVLLHAAGITVALTLVTMLIALPVGLVIALARRSEFRIVRVPATAYVELMRSTPLLLQIYWLFYVLPAMGGFLIPSLTTGLLALVLNAAAYISEIFRSGITSIRQGQIYAGKALGMTRFQLFRVVVFPQALRRVTPPLASIWVSLFKDTSLISLIGVADLSFVSLQLRSQTYRVVEFTTAMAALYWLMGYPQARIVDWLYKKYEVSS